MDNLREIIRKAGGQTKVARTLTKPDKPLTPAAVGNWILRKSVPAEHAVALAELAGTTPQHLCPAVFGEPPAAPKPAVQAKPRRRAA